MIEALHSLGDALNARPWLTRVISGTVFCVLLVAERAI
jgi:hypothetical protein